MPIRTVSVQQTNSGDNKYFVVTRRSDGTTLVDAKTFSGLTAKQKRMAKRNK